ncbi:MAG TPA: hypothetical protein VLY04_20430 [Bryobacteraceae bacterium]|nr:hypothetical protein [Bryobacteraceae bacterium]
MELDNQYLEAGAWIGRQQAFAVIASKATAAQALSLQQAKETRAFERLGISWDQFCLQYAGITRTQADSLIQRLHELGEGYFRFSEIARISPDTYRQLASKIEDACIEVDGEKVELTISNAPRIRAAVRRLRAQLKDARENTERLRSPDIAQLTARVDALIENCERLRKQYLFQGRTQDLRGLAAYAIEKWTKFAEAIAL